ncbi:hypothetical protein D3C87_116750 [compost metagenome]
MNSTDTLLIKQARLDSNSCIAKKDVAGVSKHWMKDFVQIAGDGSYTIGKAKIAQIGHICFQIVVHCLSVFLIQLPSAMVEILLGKVEHGIIKMINTTAIMPLPGAK